LKKTQDVAKLLFEVLKPVQNIFFYKRIESNNEMTRENIIAFIYFITADKILQSETNLHSKNLNKIIPTAR
jgi:hypothetical protein